MQQFGFPKTNRSAFFNFLRAKYELYTGQVDVKSYPYYVSMDPSDRCQLRCPTCPTGIENESRRSKTEDPIIFRRDRTMLSPELYDALLEEMGEYLFLIMFYNYGEPLLNEHVPTFIRKAKAYNIDTEIHTNLSLPLSDEYIESLLGSGLDRIHASIDGFSQENYQIHRVGGNVELVKGNLQRLVKARQRLHLNTEITYNFLVFSHNEHEIPAIQRFCQELGINFNRREAFIHDPDWLPSYRKQEVPWEVPQAALLREDAPLGWSPLPSIEETHCPSGCGWHYGYSVVTSSGSIAPCCAATREEHDLGKVIPGSVSFAQVWNNHNYRKSRAFFAGKDTQDLDSIQTVCTQCPYPKALHHLYSIHDFKVIAQFNNVFKNSDPVLEQGFDLFCRSRYNQEIHKLFQDGMEFLSAHPFVGHESDKDTAKFVEFFEQFCLPKSELQTV